MIHCLGIRGLLDSDITYIAESTNIMTLKLERKRVIMEKGKIERDNEDEEN
jgi:hypothetical protein